MEEVTTADAPKAIGPYSQAIVDDGRVYVSGQGPLDPESGEIVGKTVGEETAQTLRNIEAILNAAGTSIENTLKTTVYLADMSDYDAVNEVYEQQMTAPYPARAAVEVGEFPIDVRVEIESVATL